MNFKYLLTTEYCHDSLQKGVNMHVYIVIVEFNKIDLMTTE
jgi:hypothetical protein